MWFLDIVPKHIYEQLKEHTLEIPFNFVHIAFPPIQSITFISFWAKSMQLNINSFISIPFNFVSMSSMPTRVRDELQSFKK
jgi:hypothetical protein